MAKNTGQNYRKGSVDNRTQSENPKTDNWTKRDQDPDSEHEGEFMDVKEDGNKFKGVAEEPDGRRKISNRSILHAVICLAPNYSALRSTFSLTAFLLVDGIYPESYQ